MGIPVKELVKANREKALKEDKELLEKVPKPKKKKKKIEEEEEEQEEEEDDDDDDDDDDEQKEEGEKQPQEVGKDELLLRYEQQLLDLNDVEMQLKKRQIALKDEARIGNVASEQTILQLLVEKQFLVSQLKSKLLEMGFDNRDLEDVEKRVSDGYKSYDLWTLKT